MTVYIKHLHFIIIMSMNVVGLRLYVLSYATHSLSDDADGFLFFFFFLFFFLFCQTANCCRIQQRLCL